MAKLRERGISRPRFTGTKLTVEERAALEEAARERGCSISAVLRESVQRAMRRRRRQQAALKKERGLAVLASAPAQTAAA